MPYVEGAGHFAYNEAGHKAAAAARKRLKGKRKAGKRRFAGKRKAAK